MPDLKIRVRTPFETQAYWEGFKIGYDLALEDCRKKATEGLEAEKWIPPSSRRELPNA